MFKKLLIAATVPAVCQAGVVEAGEKYGDVVCEISGMVSDTVRAKATAVAINTRWVVTAAHVINGCRDLSLRFADGSTIPVDASAMHPDWSDKQVGRCDIAICRAGRPIPARKYPKIASKCRASDRCVIAGFGMHGCLADGALRYDGRLRAGTNCIDRVERNLIACTADRNGSPLEYLIASGDSGGPLFVDGELAGIHSFTQRDTGTLMNRYGSESLHTLVCVYRDWITATMEAIDAEAD